MKLPSNTVIVTDPDGEEYSFKDLVVCCDKMEGFSYDYLRGLKLPRIYKGKYYIRRLTIIKK